MMIQAEQRITVAEFLADMVRRYGGLRRFRTYVRTHPRDMTARLDLEDFEYFRGRPELGKETMERAVTLIPVADDALSVFTNQRLALLDVLARESIDSVRGLARRMGRDVHNVHADVRLFEKVGLITFERGARNRRAPRLVADSIRVVLTPSSPEADRPRAMAP